MEKKILVAYFSASGVTKAAAEKIAEAVGAELFEIEPRVPYSAADLDWRDKRSRTSLETADSGARPEIKGVPEAFDSYDTVFIGFPIWWYVEPRIIDSFLDAIDYSGKRLIPFATSGGSKIDSVMNNLRKCYPDADRADGALVTSGSAADMAKKIIKA